MPIVVPPLHVAPTESYWPFRHCSVLIPENRQHPKTSRMGTSNRRTLGNIGPVLLCGAME